MTFEKWFDKEGGYDGGFDTYQSAAESAWDAAYKQAYNDAYADAAYPEGYVLVPVEPTEKMEEAGLEVHPWDYTEDMQKIYKAMIQAAQEEE